MKRLIHLFIATMVIASFGCSTKEKTGGPNLLIIQTDEHNFRTLGCYRDIMPADQAYMWGPAVVNTPHIDRIAKEGALCSKFYATSPLCSPSRSSFVSGMYPQNTPVVNNNIPLYDSIVTFAEILKQHGYATGYAGKWHLDGKSKTGWGTIKNDNFNQAKYYGMVKCIDDNVGKILRFLEQNKMLDHTIVIFTSDNESKDAK